MTTDLVPSFGLAAELERNSDRFWKKVDRSGDCWLWTAAVGSDGYAKCWFRRKVMHASRAAYTLTKGEIPEGLVIDHLCRNTLCVNPDHLEAVTQRENVLRGENHMAHQARRTHCIHGHEFTPENTYNHKGHRYCRTCRARIQRGLKRNRRKAA